MMIDVSVHVTGSRVTKALNLKQRGSVNAFFNLPNSSNLIDAL